MLRNRRVWVLGLALLAAPAFAAEPAWETLAPPDTGLTVEVPGKATLNEDNSDPELIASQKTFTVAGEAGTEFAVTVIDFKPESRENMSDDQYYTVGIDLIKDCMLRNFTYLTGDDPESGRLATYLCTGTNARAEVRLKGLRLYMLVAKGPEQTSEGEDAKRFFSSFKAD